MTSPCLVREFSTYVQSNNLSLFPAEPGSPIDLSKARKLKDVALLSISLNIQWVTTALRTITTNHRNFQKVSLRAPCLLHRLAPTFNHDDPAVIRRRIGEVTHTQWSEFDHLLAQLLESRLVRLELLYGDHKDRTACRCANSLLPKVTKRGTVDLVSWKLR